jgi:hypothetical protein
MGRPGWTQLLAERARSECAHSMRAVEPNPAISGRSLLVVEGEGEEDKRGAVVATGKTSELSAEQVKQHLVV